MAGNMTTFELHQENLQDENWNNENELRNISGSNFITIYPLGKGLKAFSELKIYTLKSNH